jgi:hypothetical protein
MTFNYPVGNIHMSVTVTGTDKVAIQSIMYFGRDIQEVVDVMIQMQMLEHAIGQQYAQEAAQKHDKMRVN